MLCEYFHSSTIKNAFSLIICINKLLSPIKKKIVAKELLKFFDQTDRDSLTYICTHMYVTYNPYNILVLIYYNHVTIKIYTRIVPKMYSYTHTLCLSIYYYLLLGLNSSC